MKSWSINTHSKTEHPPGSFSLFLQWDIRSWALGPGFEIDGMWFDFHLDIGPLRVVASYWRKIDDLPS